MTKTGNHEFDSRASTSIVSVIVCLLENMPGKLDEDLPQMLVFLADELNHLYIAMDCWKAYQSMVLQGFAMAFAYNSNLVF